MGVWVENEWKHDAYQIVSTRRAIVYSWMFNVKIYILFLFTLCFIAVVPVLLLLMVVMLCCSKWLLEEWRENWFWWRVAVFIEKKNLLPNGFACSKLRRKKCGENFFSYSVLLLVSGNHLQFFLLQIPSNWNTPNSSYSENCHISWNSFTPSRPSTAQSIHPNPSIQYT